MTLALLKSKTSKRQFRSVQQSVGDGVVFIDSAVDNYSDLVAGVLQGLETIVLNPNEEGLAQIGWHLSYRQEIRSIHIVGHGKPGQIRLGSSLLTLENLGIEAESLAQWKTALAPNAEILIYGCEVGATLKGLSFIQSLSRLTGAKVAASFTKVGNQTLGGHWDLDVTTGIISSPLAFSINAMSTYPAILSENYLFDTFNFSESLSLDPNGALNSAIGSVKNLLQNLSQDSSRFYNTLGQVLGSTFDVSLAESFRIQWSSGDFSQIPTIKILDSGMAPGMLGAYARSTNNIYLAQSIIDAEQPNLISNILLEEIGHFLDAKLNVSDTPGDEGELFSAIVRDIYLSQDQYDGIQSKDDSDFITVNGELISVEAHSSYYVYNSPAAVTYGPYSVNEGSSVYLNGSYSYDRDVYYQALHTSVVGVQYDNGYSSWTVTDYIVGGYWMVDGQTLNGTSVSYSTPYSGTKTATLYVQDNEGTWGNSSTNVYVNNVAPSISSLWMPTGINEGNSSYFDGYLYDPGWESNHYVSYSLGNGYSRTFSLGSGGQGSRYFYDYFQYSNNGTYTAQFYVGDSDGGTSSTISQTVTVYNVSPSIYSSSSISSSITERSDGAIDENSFNHVSSGSLYFYDPGSQDTHTVTITPLAGNYLGNMTAMISDSATGDRYGTINWNFTVSDSTLDSLRHNQTLTQTYTVTVRDNDGGTGTQNVTITLIGQNDAPTIANSITAQSASEDNVFSFTVPANIFSDVDAGDTLSYSASLSNGNALPTWLSFHPTTRTFSGTPTNDDVGSLNLQVTATDSSGASVSSTFNVAIANVNDAPSFRGNATLPSILEDTTNPAGQSIASLFSGLVSDPDAGASLKGIAVISNPANEITQGKWQYSVNNGTNWFDIFSVSSSGIAFSASTLLRFVPVANYNGTPPSLVVRALDDTFSSAFSSGGILRSAGITTTGGTTSISANTATISIAVTEVNDIPTATSSLSAQNALQGFPFSFTVPTNTFSDVDQGEILTYSATLSTGNPLPSWLTFNPSTLTFSGTPTIGDLGNLTIQVIATDRAGASAIAPLALTIAAPKPGNLDPTFGTGGKVSTDFNTYSDFAQSVLVQPDGKIVVAGYSLISSGDYDFALARYNSNGTLDPTFGTGGKVTTFFYGNEFGRSLIQQKDGKLVVAGETGYSSTDFALARYNSNGTLDTTFGTGGKVTTDFNASNDSGFSIIQQSDEKLVIAGTATRSGNYDFALARYNSNGTLDTTFGTGGKVTTDFNGFDDIAKSVIQQSDGKLLVTGSSNNGTFALARYNSNGTLDTTFGTAGKVITAGTGASFSATLQSDNKIILVGSNSSDFVITRYLNDSPNQTPTDIGLSNNSIAENSATGSIVGIFSTIDTDANNTFTYSLVSGTGSTDNSAFTISGNQLQINTSPDFEAKSSYSILIRTTDQGGLFYDKTFAITVNDLNEAPSYLSTSANAVSENLPTDTVVGILNSWDPDLNNTFTYTLVSGEGDADNSAFKIVGDSLQTSTSFDYETKSSYNIRVRTTDQNGLSYEKALIINVVNLKEDGAPDPYLVKNIAFTSNSSFPQLLTKVGNTLYFRAVGDNTGFELWKSDGTEAGTSLVKDINPGYSTSGAYQFTDVNGTLFFVANHPTYGWELWKSDGTEAGTVLIKDINSGSSGSDPYLLTNVNGTLFFRTYDSTNGTQLWKSDGTAAGTVLVKDMAPGSGGFISYMTNINDILYFMADDGVNGSELWKSDGTNAGTILVKNINPSGSSNPSIPISVNNTLYFNAYHPTSGLELWKSDGTDTGTTLVKDIRPGTSSSNVGNLTNLNNLLYFSVSNPLTAARDELWKSDGTAAGTVLIKDINLNNSVYSYFHDLINVNGTLYFVVEDGVEGSQLWKSDGTEAGTVLVKDFQPGLYNNNVSNLIDVNGVLYFKANGGNGFELWKSDGTEAGTVVIKDLYPGATYIGSNDSLSGSNLLNLAHVNGKLFFGATDGTNGFELWALNTNSDPVVGNAIAPQTAIEEQPFSFTIPADSFSDPDGDALTYTATLANGNALPTWITFNPNTRTFSGTPDDTDLAPLNIKVIATESSGAFISQIFQVSITPVNDPTIITGPTQQIIDEDTSLVFSSATGNAIILSDQDAGNSLFSVYLMTSGSVSLGDTSGLSNIYDNQSFTGTIAAINAALNGLTFYPASNFNGNANLQIMVSDTVNIASSSFTVPIQVNSVNDAPILSLGIQPSVDVGQFFSFNFFEASDPDDGYMGTIPLTYSATLADGSALPSWINFNPLTRTFSGTPSISNAGTFDIKVTVSDGQASTSDIFTLTSILTVIPPSVSTSHIIVDEGDSGTSNAVFTVNLSAASSQTITLNYTTADNTAFKGYDYTLTSGILTFAPNETSKTITIPIMGDTYNESNETFKLLLSNPTNAVISTPEVTATIIDNDPVPTLSINNVSGAEGDNGTRTLTFNVQLSAASGQAITVNYATADNTLGANSATAGVDYVATNGTLTFAPGSTLNTIKVTINGDTTIEPDETFLVNLSNPTGGAILGQSQGIGTIINDESGISYNGTSGNDSFVGGNGDDQINGNQGNDTFDGSAGNDIINGGAGADVLTGGLGADTFRYGAFTDSLFGSTTQDRIRDFNLSQGDRIGLSMLPTATYNAGLISASSLTAAVNAVYADADSTTTGNQALGINQAVFFSFGATVATRRTYMSVNDGNSGFNANSDLFIEITGMAGTLNLGSLTTSNYFSL